MISKSDSNEYTIHTFASQMIATKTNLSIQLNLLTVLTTFSNHQEGCHFLASF
ncbi:MAG: hypothetical protein RLZZ535_2446 [Cyanobacteriota bacterium]